MEIVLLVALALTANAGDPPGLPPASDLDRFPDYWRVMAAAEAYERWHDFAVFRGRVDAHRAREWQAVADDCADRYVTWRMLYDAHTHVCGASRRERLAVLRDRLGPGPYARGEMPDPVSPLCFEPVED